MSDDGIVEGLIRGKEDLGAWAEGTDMGVVAGLFNDPLESQRGRVQPLERRE